MSKPNCVQKDKPTTPQEQEPSKDTTVDAALVIKSISTAIALKRECDILRAANERFSNVNQQLNRIIEDKDRAFCEVMRERDALREDFAKLTTRHNYTDWMSRQMEKRASFWKVSFWALFFSAGIILFAVCLATRIAR